jgi:hypothetical protein
LRKFTLHFSILSLFCALLLGQTLAGSAGDTTVPDDEAALIFGGKCPGVDDDGECSGGTGCSLDVSYKAADDGGQADNQPDGGDDACGGTCKRTYWVECDQE